MRFGGGGVGGDGDHVGAVGYLGVEEDVVRKPEARNPNDETMTKHEGRRSE